MKYQYALTGGIACGKSTVGRVLEEHGWRMIDTDVIARDLLRPGSQASEKVIDAFGPAIVKPNKQIDRAALAGIVFSDEAKLGILNAILHPLIREEWQKSYQTLASNNDATPIVVTIPLLFEVHLNEEFERTIAVGCSGSLQRKRLLDRGLSEANAQQRIDSQLPVAMKLERSDIVVWNNGSMDLLLSQVKRLVRESGSFSKT